MATGPGVNQGKSAFVKEHFHRDKDANETKISEAWKAAGNEGTISGSLVSKIKSEMGLTGKHPSPKRTATRSTAGEVKTRSSRKSARTDRARSLRGGHGPGTNGRHNSEESGASSGSDHARVLHSIEGELDEMIFRLKGLGGFHEVEEALRTARRLLVRSHGE